MPKLDELLSRLEARLDALDRLIADNAHRLDRLVPTTTPSEITR